MKTVETNNCVTFCTTLVRFSIRKTTSTLTVRTERFGAFHSTVLGTGLLILNHHYYYCHYDASDQKKTAF